jgi:molecular chaperone DnaK
MPQIEVAFDIDSNGIVSVSATDKATAKEQKITIQASGGLSDDDIKKMVKDAEAFASEDKKKKEKVEINNQADSIVYSTEKSLKEYGDKISPDVKSKIEEKLETLKSSLGSDDVSIIKKNIDELTQAAMAMGEAMYKEQQEANAENASHQTESSSSDDGGKVVDADFEEINEDDKK